MLLLTLLACPPAKDADSVGDTGSHTAPDSGLGTGADMPAYCSETGRAPVADLTVPAEGFSFSPQDVLSGDGGDWVGTFSPVTGAPSALALSFVRPDDGAVEAVSYTLVDPSGGGDTGPATEGAGYADCPSAYEI